MGFSNLVRKGESGEGDRVLKGSVVSDTEEKTRVMQEIGVPKGPVVTDTGVRMVRMQVSKGMGAL